MRPKRALLTGVLCLSVGACGAPPSPPGKPIVSVSLEPESPLDAASRVVRVHLGDADFDPRLLRLVEGDLSSYYLGQIQSGLVPSTLAERLVAATAWRDASGGLWLAPSIALSGGATFSVAALGVGLLTTLTVTTNRAPIATRVWPPHGALGGKRWVFCGAALPDLDASALPRFEPGDVPASVSAGADDAGVGADRCFRLQAKGARAEGVAVVPPPVLGGVSLDPSPSSLGEGSTPPPLACDANEIAIASGCARVFDDRAVIRSSGPTLWTMELNGRSLVEPAEVGAPFVVTGLLPSSQVSVSGAATALSGVATPFDATWSTSAATSHVVINEVLANSIGPEPSEEWVELFNDGSSAVDVGGFTLSDGVERTALPYGTLSPGAFALVVSSKYSLVGPDLPPAAGTLLLRVARIGRQGISNSGEQLELDDADGRVLSRFPAVAASKAGVSVSRADPEALDDDATAFAPSGGQGATPGAPNVLGP